MIRLDGDDVTSASPERRVARGLARTFEVSSLFRSLTVAEHVGLALAARQRLDARPSGRLALRRDLADEAAAVLESVGLLVHARSPFRFAETISVLVEGAILLESTPTEVRSDARVRDVYLGTRPHG